MPLFSYSRRKIALCDHFTCELARIEKSCKFDEGKAVKLRLSCRARPTLSIRVMTEADLLVTAKWATREGWNPGCADSNPFRQTDQEGFFMGYLGGRRVVSISSVRYGKGYGFIGFCICSSEYRGQGYSLTMFKRAMNHLEGRVIGLDAVIAQEAKYATQGFITAHDVTRFKGKVIWLDEHAKLEDDLVVETPSENCMKSLLAFDRQHFPAVRERFVRAWVHNRGHVVRVAVKNGTVVGYGVRRPSADGARVGPLFATSSSVASVLLRAITADDPEVEVCVDIPEPNRTGLELAEHAGLKRLCTFKRMYRGAPPDIPLGSIFASTTTLELG